MTHQPRALSGSEELKLFAGLVIQPILAAGLTFFLFPALLLDSNGRTLAGGFPGDAVGAAWSVAIGAGIVAFFVALVGALPSAIWLMKRRTVTFGEALLWGLLFGNAPMFVGIVAGSYGVAGFLRGVAFSSVLGAAGAGAFWAIALRRQLDRIPRPADIALPPDERRVPWCRAFARNRAREGGRRDSSLIVASVNTIRAGRSAA